MFLAPVAEIRSQLGFDDMTDINAAIAMALNAAEPQLAAVLNTEFDRGTFVDTFYVSRPPFRDGPAVETEFRLRRGLVVSITSVLLSSDPTVFGVPASVVDITAVANLEADKGVVKDFKTRFERQYVQITYVAGFAAAVDPLSYDLTQVPAWLQNAAKLKTLMGLADSAVLAEAKITIDTKMLGQQLNSLLSRKLRYAPLSILPL